MKIKFLGAVFFLANICVAQNKTTIHESANTPLLVSSTQTLIDPYYSTAPSNTYDYYKPVFWVEFSYDLKSNTFYETTSFDTKVEVRIDYWEQGNTSSSPSGSKTLWLNLQRDATKLDAKNKIIEYQAISSTNDIYKADIEVLNVAGLPSISNMFRLKLKMFAHYVFQPQLASYTNISTNYTSGVSKMDVTWVKNNSSVIAPDEYDFEWTFIDSLSEEAKAYQTYLNQSNTNNQLNFPFDSFRYSRLTTQTTGVNNIPLLYTGGYIVYRFREVFYNLSGERMTGPWISSKIGAGSKPQLLVQKIVGHERALNWFSNIQFAEQAKHSENISYYDGTLRNRQHVGFSNTHEKAFIKESYYDKEGRLAASVLPFPYLGTNSTIRYYQEINVDSASMNPYSESNFNGSGDCSAFPTPLSRQKGASQYYSSQNPYVNIGYHSFIPNADGYPFTSFEYENDKTQRVRRQGGLGREFQLGSGKESRYFYSKAYREEIDRLFGTDVGYNNYYYKTASLDPNGQLSITYKDKDERVIATALAGEAANGAIRKNSNNLGNYPINYNLIDPKEVEIRSDAASGHTRLFVSGSQTMDFYISANSIEYRDSCETILCSDCYYDIDVAVKSNCIPFAQDKHIRYTNYDNLDFIDTICESKVREVNDSFSQLLPTGNYNISASLSVPQKVIDFYTEKYLRDEACITPLDSLIKKHRAKMTPCIKDCDSCLALYGNVDSTVQRMYQQLKKDGQSFADPVDSADIFAELYVTANKSKESCEFFCKKSNACDMMYDLIIADVSPGGQYAMQWDTSRGRWKFSTLSIYLDTNNYLAMEGIFRPNGDTFKFRNYKELEELVDIFHDSIAQKLFKYHPEYCYYLYCDSNYDHHDFIDSLNTIETWSDAVSKGLLPASSQGNNWKNAASYLVNGDPYHKVKAPFTTELRNYFITSTLTPNYDDTLSLFDIALVQANLGFLSLDANNKLQVNYSYLDTTGCTGLKNVIWNQFKFLYQNAVGIQYGKDIKLACPYTDSLKIGLCNEELTKSKFFSLVDPAFFPYCKKMPRYFNYYTIDTTFKGDLNRMRASMSSGQMQQDAYDKMKVECKLNCVRQADGWVAAIGDCKLKGDVNSMKKDLIAICQNSCEENGNDFGNSSTRHGELILLPEAKIYASTFQEVIDFYKLNSNDTVDCNANNIDMIYPFGEGHKAYTTQNKIMYKDSCICSNLSAIVSNMTYSSIADLHSQLQAKYGDQDYNTSEEHLEILLNLCNNPDTLCVYPDKPIAIPNIFACQNRVNCLMLNKQLRQFYSVYPNLNSDFSRVKSSPKYRKLFRSFMNKGLKMSLSFMDYKSFIKTCDSCKPDTTYDSTCVWIVDKYLEFIRLEKLVGTNYPDYFKTDRITGFKNYIALNYNHIATYDHLYSRLRTCLPTKFPSCTNLTAYFDSFRTQNGINPLYGNYYQFGVEYGGLMVSYLNAVLFQHKESFTQHEYINMLKSCGVTIDIDFDCGQLYHYYLNYRHRDSSFLSASSDSDYYYIDSNAFQFNMFRRFIFEHSHYKIDTAELHSLLTKCYTCDLIDKYENFNMDSLQSETDSINAVKGTNYHYADVYRFSQRFCKDTTGVTGDDPPFLSCCDFIIHYRDTTSMVRGALHMFNNLDTITFKQYQNLVFAFLWDYNLIYHNHAGINQRNQCILDYEDMKEVMEICLGLDFHIIYESNPITIVPSWEISDNPCDKVIFDRYMSPNYKPGNDCEEQMEKLAIAAAKEEYEKEREKMVLRFQTNFIHTCLSKADLKLWAKGLSNEFQFTLYYYGQDGNLLKTVPPAGVHTFPSDTLPMVDVFRANYAELSPSHSLATDYKYNSLNEVVEQHSPDAGTTKFVYDQLGRLILSQNAEQAKLINGNKRYSYTIYDYLSRIIESGEVECSPGTFDVYFGLNYKDYNVYAIDIANKKQSGTCRSVTRTYYDKNQFSAVNSQFGGLQENLRKRIVSITLDTLDSDKTDSTYHTALHYSYDLVGNVKTLVSENNLLNTHIQNQRYKRVDYDYDLVSGKVNRVTYQKDQADQFIHKYQYDAENRLTEALTSTDNIYWQKDASYEYYLHGPLARAVIGENEVQGIDYAYTLQGWLKAINTSTLNESYDMGQDGKAASANVNTARDALAFTLRYFANDYQQIGRTSFAVEAVLPAGMDTFSLYNGNISGQVVSLKNPGTFSPTQAYQYRYDQMHRIVDMDAFKPISVSSNNIGNIDPNFNAYAERISYNPNGNIQTYTRRNETGAMMDDMTYNYDAQKRNQLKQVQDAIGDGVSDADIDDQTDSDNYKYDAIGNLIRDEQEDMDISWTASGKIAEIIQRNRDIKLVFGYDPMGNRISKTVYEPISSSSPKTIYYSRDAQGNIMAVYDNHYNGLGELPCTYTANTLNQIRDDYYNDYINNILDPNVNDPFALSSLTIGFKDPSNVNFVDSCDYKARLFILSQFPDVPDPQNNQFMDPGAYAGVHMEVSNNMGMMSLQDMIVHVQSMYFSEDPAIVEAWVTFFYNVFSIQTMDIVSEVNAQNFTYIGGVAENAVDSLFWKEQHIYGSSRLGMHMPYREVAKSTYSLDSIIQYHTGKRQYELTNHLGNVLSTIKDEKTQIENGGSGIVAYYEPIVYQTNDYYPFGMQMAGRTYSLSSSDYRFGFNTQEKDDEIYGSGNSYSAQFWQYDSRIGRRWNIDPKLKIWESPYATFSNNPIWFTDVHGDSSTTLPNGRTGELPESFTYSDDKKIIYNNYKGDDKKWDYARLNEETNVYDFHFISPKNEMVEDIDNGAGAIETGIEAIVGIIEGGAKHLDDVHLGKEGASLVKGLGVAGKFLGVTQVVTSGYEFYQNPTWGSATKLVVNSALVVGRVNPITGVAIGLLDASGVLDKGYEKIDDVMNANGVKPLDIRLKEAREAIAPGNGGGNTLMF